MQEALTALLLGDSGVAALCNNRVHWRLQPALQKDFPCLSLSLISEPRGYTLDGEAWIREARVQVDAWATNYGGAVIVARAVTAALSGYRGEVSGIEIHGLFADGSRDMDGEIGDRRVFGVSSDYLVKWSDAEG